MSGSSLPLLYEDEHLVVVDKPAWAIVHKTRGASDALVIVTALAESLGAAVYPVHRLDRQTSGVLLFAKSSAAAEQLSVEFREGRVRKSYLGLCRGVIEDCTRVEHPVPEESARRPACTEIEPLEVFCDRYTLLRARPLTGRHHQIRYHLKHIDHPLAGDTQYGKGDINRFFRSMFELRRLFLHAESMRILHPTQLRYLEISSPLATELQAVLKRLRAHRGAVV